MYTDPKLSELLNDLSEESLFKLLQHVQARARRAALKEDAAGDLEPLRILQSAVDHAHIQKLG